MEKNKIFKICIIPIFYTIIGTVFFGNQDLMIIIFLSFIPLIYHYLIDGSKSFKNNFIEMNGVIIFLFIVSLFFKETNKIIVIKYISMILFLFSVIFYLKKKRVT